MIGMLWQADNETKDWMVSKQWAQGYCTEQHDQEHDSEQMYDQEYHGGQTV